MNSVIRLFLLLSAISSSVWAGAVQVHTNIYFDAGAEVRSIADALKKYSSDHAGQLPGDIRDLCPKYLPNESSLWLHGTTSSSISGSRLCFLPKNPISNPDSPSQSMLAFMSSEVDGGGRFIIDTQMDVWFVGEGKFQNWLAGDAMFDRKQ